MDLFYGSDSNMDFFFESHKPAAGNRHPFSANRGGQETGRRWGTSFLSLNTISEEMYAADLPDETDAPPSGSIHKADSAYWDNSSVDDEDELGLGEGAILDQDPNQDQQDQK